MIRPYKVSTVEKGLARVVDVATGEQVGHVTSPAYGGWSAYRGGDQIGLLCRTRDEAAQLLWDFVNA